MSTKKPNEPQNADDFILNPYTKRLIRKDSKTYKRLLNAKLLDAPQYKNIDDARQDNLIIKADDVEEAKKLQSRISKASVEPHQHISRRNDKVIKCNRRPTQNQTIEKVSDIAINTVIENRDDILDQDMSDEEMDRYIRKMIQLKLIGHNDKPVKKPITKNIIPPKNISRFNDEDEY